ncbi:MAG TPA: hypothetical protein EYG34_09065, partial [Acidimicrobiia bacterium]|nr:hypothetical protein [Acidimicrobiia bacterium]
MKNVRKLLAIMLAFTVIATACGSDEETPTATTAAPTTTAAPETGAYLGDGSLGEVRVDDG